MCLGGKNDVYVSIMISKGNVVPKPSCNALCLQRLASYGTREGPWANDYGFHRLVIDLRPSIVLPIIIMFALTNISKLHFKTQSTYHGRHYKEDN